MNPKSYQPQNNPNSTRARCPVCHEAVYSRAGIHPQCAVRQADQIEQVRLKMAKSDSADGGV